MGNKAFSLTELVVIIFVLGLLASLAMPNFKKQVERGRAREAFRILGEIRIAQEIWKKEHGSYSNNLSELGFDYLPQGGGNCNINYYFRYGFDGNGNPYAQRCGGGGKEPQDQSEYIVTFDLATGSFDSEVD